MADLREFTERYYERFVVALQSFDRRPLEDVLEVLERVARDGGTLWVAGNGGSAAISDHTTCDVTKGTFVPGRPPIRSLSLASNGAMLTALANDISYDQVFRQQLEYYLRPGDAVLLVSSSGNSPNVVKACEYANARGVPTIAFVGFDGGRLKSLAAHCVWIQVDNYGIVEDTHQSLVHVMTQFLRSREGSPERKVP